MLLLALVEPVAALELVYRLAPVFTFVIGMSVVVNISSQVGLFEAVTSELECRLPNSGRSRSVVLWLGIVGVSVLVTIFLSLDTTAILLTPLAVVLSRRNGLNIAATALTVIWIANIASLMLPVSNLTNLLAMGRGPYSSSIDFVRVSFAPALVAILIALGASGWMFLRSKSGRPLADSYKTTESDLLLSMSLLVVGGLLPALISPIPYWISSTVAAVLLILATIKQRRELLTFGLVPWASIMLATSFSAAASLVHVLGATKLVESVFGGAESSLVGLLLIAGAGAVLSNLVNNIPAFLALEPAVNNAVGYMALLIGTNVGPIVTPWASLATLLWHDQLRRLGVQFGWVRYSCYGAVLAPVAVGLPTALLLFQIN